MSSNVEGASAPSDRTDVNELTARVEANADDLAELLDLLIVTKHLGEDLAPELKCATADSRGSLEELRLALEREETLVLIQKVGENAETFIELFDMLEATKSLADDLAPELKTAAAEARGPLEEVRLAFENQETLLLFQKLGQNTETFIELLDLLEATEGLLSDLTPELKAATGESRSAFEQLRLVAAGFESTHNPEEIDPYELGQNLGNMLWLGNRLGDPAVTESIDAGLSAFTDESASRKIGPLGLINALRDENVRRALGTLVEFLRRMGVAQRRRK